MPREKWSDRTFTFALPVGRFPSVLERLRGTPARLEERTRAIPAAVLTRAPEGRWSAQGNVGHLADAEAVWLRRAEQILADEAELVGIPATAGDADRTPHDARPLDDLLAEFRAGRERLVQRLATADDASLARSALHPRLQRPMRLIDLAEFIADHDDYHLAVITELSA